MYTIPHLWWGFRVLDILLIPIMWVLNKCRLELPQETHPWHCAPWEGDIQKTLCVHISGVYERRHRFSPLFHMPLLGTGWEDYIVVQPTDFTDTWFVGWKALGSKQGTTVNLLALKYGSPVRLLISKGDVTFFALDSQGRQIKLQQISKGHLGDHKFSHVRQF